MDEYREIWKNVDRVLPWLNDWCEDALDLRIARLSNDDYSLWLQIRVFGPPRTRHLEGHRIAETMRTRAWIPVTDDRAMILKLLGFSEPKVTLAALQKPHTDQMTCSILCGSRLFDPSMAKDTKRFCKFGGKASTLFSYVQEMCGDVVASEKDKRDIDLKLETIHRVIERIFPKVVATREAFMNHELMHGRLQDTLWGPSISHLSSASSSSASPIVRKYHKRWTRYLELRGLEALNAQCISDPAAALADWLEFRGDESQCPYDWSETL